MDPAPFLRGNPYPATKRDPYPRAKPGDGRIPGDTWAMATIPVGVRLEFSGDAEAIEIEYETRLAEPGWQGEKGRRFVLWREGAEVAHAVAEHGTGRARLTLGGALGARADTGRAHAAAPERSTVYLPERMLPRVLGIEAFGGSIEPAAPQPRWLCYGDSIVEGWTASEPACAWPSIVAREHALDLVNMGYAGAARGELASAEHLAELGADMISIAFGTNCWGRIPFTPGLIRETLIAFLDTVRQGHPTTPILVQSMLLRPDAEHTPHRLGATHSELRDAMENVVRASADPHTRLVEGAHIIDASMLSDDVHPHDVGHRAIATALGPILGEMAH